MPNALTLPALPTSLKSIGHYLKTASEHESRDPVVSYWSRLHALQTGLKLDKKSKEALAVLIPLMDWLEKEKKALHDNEAITNEVVASAHVENAAVKLFNWADREDRASKFNKNVVKAFYTSGMLFDVMTVFGDLTPENAQMRKYAKWKAAYIHNCLKSGETPIPGPAANPEEDQENAGIGGETEHSSDWDKPIIGANSSDTPTTTSHHPSQPVQPQSQPSAATGYDESEYSEPKSSDLTPEQVSKAKKYCKFVASALDYDDKVSAIDNLQKALNILKFGHE